MRKLIEWLRQFRDKPGVCRYCECEIEPDQTICDECWGNNGSW